MKFCALLLALLLLSVAVTPAPAQTAIANGPCLSFTVGSTNNTETNAIAASNRCSYPVGAYACYSTRTPATCTTAILIVNGLSSATVAQTPIAGGLSPTGAFGFECPAGSTATAGLAASVTAGTSGVPCAAVTASNIAASVLPLAFASEIDKGATVFATMESTGATLQNCRIALAEPASPDLEFEFQQTNPTTNAVIGKPNLPVTLTGKPATFVLDFASTTPLQMADLPLIYSCDGAVSPISTAGLSSVDVDFTAGATANIVAEAETPSRNGILTVPQGGAGAFAVATDNAGNVAATVTVKADTGATALPATITLCQTNASTGACLAPPAVSLTVSVGVGATPTFSVFVSASGSIAANAAANRIFVRFELNGVELGATSVAVQT
jgi:hypothetical protein